MSKYFFTREKTRQAAANAVHEQEVLFKSFYFIFPISEHLFEYIGTQFPPPSAILYGKMRGGTFQKCFCFLHFCLGSDLLPAGAFLPSAPQFTLSTCSWTNFNLVFNNFKKSVGLKHCRLWCAPSPSVSPLGVKHQKYILYKPPD